MEKFNKISNKIIKEGSENDNSVITIPKLNNCSEKNKKFNNTNYDNIIDNNSVVTSNSRRNSIKSHNMHNTSFNLQPKP